MFPPNPLQAVRLQANCFFDGGYTLPAVATFGENVKRLRLAAGLRGNQLAARVRVKPPVITGWEKNRGGLPETPTLLKLAKALRCTIDDLLSGVDAEYDVLAIGVRGGAIRADGRGGDDATVALTFRQLREHVAAMLALLDELQSHVQAEAGSQSGNQTDAATPATERGSSQRSR